MPPSSTSDQEGRTPYRRVALALGAACTLGVVAWAFGAPAWLIAVLAVAIGLAIGFAGAGPGEEPAPDAQPPAAPPMRSPPPTPGAQPRDTQGPSEAEPSTGELSGLRVLVADDSAMNRRIIATFMERAGAEVDAVDGGAGAVEAGLGRHYDCILMDIRMPDMSGPEALRALRKGGCESPIIAVTAENAPNAVPQYQQAGFADVVFKPTPTARLVALIQHHVGRGAEAAPTPAPESTAEPSPRQEPDTDPDAAPDAAPDAPVDTERAIRAAGGNAAFAAKLYAEFMDELRRQCDSLAQASAQDLAEIAHRIAGGARYCGAGRLEAAALSSEHAAQTADDGASVERARSTLREAVERQLALPDPYASRD